MGSRDLLTSLEAAEILGCSRDILRFYAKTRLVKAFRPKGKQRPVKFRRSDIEALAKHRERAKEIRIERYQLAAERAGLVKKLRAIDLRVRALIAERKMIPLERSPETRGKRGHDLNKTQELAI